MKVYIYLCYFSLSFQFGCTYLLNSSDVNTTESKGTDLKTMLTPTVISEINMKSEDWFTTDGTPQTAVWKNKTDISKVDSQTDKEVTTDNIIFRMENKTIGIEDNNSTMENESFTEPNPTLDHNGTNGSISNISNVGLDIIEPELQKSQMFTHMIIECIIMAAICGGNIVVLISIWRYKSLHTVNNMFLVSLAMGDLIMGVLGSPMSIITLYITPLLYGTHVQDKYLCATRLSSMVASVGISIYSMVGIAIDRYIAVVRPLRYRELVTHTKALSYIVFLWTYVIVGSAFIFYKDVIFFESGEICRSNLVMNQEYSLFLKANLLAAFTISTVAHITVAVVASKHKARITTELAQFNNNLAVAYRKENRITKTMTVVVGVFMLCWLPWTISSVVQWEKEPQWFTSLRYYMVELHVANSALNPLIYAYRLKPMRKAMGHTIKCNYKGTITSD